MVSGGESGERSLVMDVGLISALVFGGGSGERSLMMDMELISASNTTSSLTIRPSACSRSANFMKYGKPQALSKELLNHALPA